MEVGSLVVCINNSGVHHIGIDYGAIIPKLNTVYTVRDIRTDNYSLLLEEIDNSHLIGRNFKKREPGFNVKRFRELQPPIANIEEHINENTLEPELV